jgi:hypothetical protein
MKPDEKTARLTREGAVFGTPAYMSPEQVKGQGTVDHRADLWALGCMTFECLTGRPVWNIDQGVAMTFASIAASALPVPSEMRPGLPATFDTWFRHALERDPNMRFQTARELADSLARALGEAGFTSLKSGELDVVSLLASVNRSAADLDESLGIPGARASSPAALDAAKVPPAVDSGRLLGVSALEVPGTSGPTSASRGARPRGQALRYFVSILGFAISSGGAYVTWDKVLRPQVKPPLVQSTVAYTPEPSAAPANPGVTVSDTPRWQSAIEDGQQLFAVGDLAAAEDKFRRAQELGAPPAAAHAFAEETRAGIAGGGDCKMVAFSRPRMALGGNALRPSVASSAKRTLLSWSDDHEQAGHEHVYAVLLDPVGRPLSRPRDLTPEAADASHASLLAVGDRMALIYADKAGPEVGVRARWIDEEGRIAGASLQVGGVRSGAYWPRLARAPDGFFATWEDDRKQDGSDLYVRHLGSELDAIGPEVRATDFIGRAGHRPFVRAPSVAVANNALYVVYQMEREGKPHSIDRMRIALDAPLLATGLDVGPTAASKADRVLGDVQHVSESPADSPDIACGTEGCFVAWHGEKGGAYAALIDPVQGRVIWRKKFAERGSVPALGVSDDGGVDVAYFEKGLVKIATLTRDGVGTPSTIAKVWGEQPKPALAPGQSKGEWFVAWQDTEGTHSEIYVARVACH